MTKQIINETFIHVTKNWQKVFFVIFICWFPVYALNAVIILLGDFTLQEGIRNQLILSSLVFPVILGAVYFAVYNEARNTSVSVVQSVVFGLKKWLPIIIANVIAAFIVVLSSVLVVPGIYFAVKYSMISCIVCFDENRNITAMKKSYHITKGWFWPILLVSFLLGILQLIPLALSLWLPNFFTGGAYLFVKALLDFAVVAAGMLPEIALVLIFIKIRDADVDEGSGVNQADT